MGYPTYIERFTGKVIPIYPLGTKVMTNGAVVGKIIEVDTFHLPSFIYSLIE